jgi:transglutaminase-like putative cysteine protease
MKQRFAFAWLVFVIPLLPLRAQPPEAAPLREAWYEIRTDKGKLGWLHVEARAVERDGQKLIHTTQREMLSFLRSGDPYTERQTAYTLETATGQVVEVGSTSTLSKKQDLRLRGKVEGVELLFRVVGEDEKEAKWTQKLPWDKEAIGLYAQERLFVDKPAKPGEKRTIKSFSLACNRVAETFFTVKGPEKTLLAGEERELLRVEQTFPKQLYLTPSTVWFDAEGWLVKQQEDSPLFGLVTYTKVTRESAESKFPATVADIEAPVQVVNPLKFSGRGPKEISVRVSLAGDDEPGTLFVKDHRQKVLKADDKFVELQLGAVNPPAAGKEAEKEPAAEYLETNYFIRSDDAKVVELAKQAVGEEKDARKKALAIRRWVTKNVQGSYETAFATADEVARNPEGDCSEMGMLCCAMCRAVGIPSRVVFGLAYDPSNPGFGGHLWTEVFVDGRWETVDPTGVVHILNAAHIKVADYSMKGILNPDELTAVRRVFAGRMKVEIMEQK